MPLEFEFATATRILFGRGKVRDLGSLARALGRRAFIVTGRSATRAERLTVLLEAAGIVSTTFHLAGEPTVQEVQKAAQLAASAASEIVIGVGGGSAVDAAKAVAALLTNPGDLFDYLEVVGRAQPLLRPSAPMIAIPTTAGTGAEVTRNAVLASPEHRFKVSLRSPFMLPRLALVDPELTDDLPPLLTATTGLDALTQLIEPYVSPRANPLTDGFCREGLACVARSLRRAVEHGADSQARDDMSLASLLSGLALANAGLGAVHGFAAPLGGMYSSPHGALCAAVLPHAMRVNVEALRQRLPRSAALARYAHVAEWLTGQPGASPEDGIAWVEEMIRQVGVGTLRTYGIESSAYSEIAEKAAQASSMKANPVVLSNEELRQILAEAY